MIEATVGEIWRYPAKSMMGERLASTNLGSAGVPGDRAWAVRDEIRGGIRGAKKLGALMRLAARYVSEPDGTLPPPPIEIELPDGRVLRSDQDDVNARISAAIDHPVTLWPLRSAEDTEHYRRGAPDTDDLMTEMRAIFGRSETEPLPDLSGFPPEIFEYESPPGTYFDAYPIHLLTTASLRSIQERVPNSAVDVRRFRPNLVVDCGRGEGEFPEQAWIGKSVSVGGAELDVVTSCPRCVMVTREFAELALDRAVLRAVVKDANQNLGVYARVRRPGEVRAGDPVQVVDQPPAQT